MNQQRQRLTRSLLIALGCLLSACAQQASKPKVQQVGAATATPLPASTHKEQAPASGPTPTAALLDLMRQGKYKIAVQAFRQTAIKHPGNALVLANLGLAQARLGQYEQASKHLQQALALMTAPPPTLLNELGRLYRQSGAFSQAEEYYRKAIAVNPTYTPAIVNLGILLEVYRRQPEKALPFYRRYQQLTDKQDKKVALWILDIEQRLPKTGRQP